MRLASDFVPQRCLECNVDVEYEGNVSQRRNVFLHRLHCHECGAVYVMPSKSKKRPTFVVKREHVTEEFAGHIPAPPDTCIYWN